MTSSSPCRANRSGSFASEGAVAVTDIAPEAPDGGDQLGPHARHLDDERALVGVGDDDVAARARDPHHLRERGVGIVEVLEHAVGAHAGEHAPTERERAGHRPRH